jgi:very-short-patch-repair endonuclease
MDKAASAKTLGFHFRRQTPIGPYIVDFAALGARIVIEIDGGWHAMPASIRSDDERDKFLQSRGFRVLRYGNSDVDRNLRGVMDDILRHLKTPTPTG